MAKILLVEDDKSLREIYGVRLMAEGYEIVSAGDGEEALAMAIKERPNLILSDVMMPKISGFDMLDILRSTTETKDVKVIMMTALSSDDQRARGESLGADRYLVKSQVGIEDVVRTVHDVLGDGVGAAAPAPAAFTTPAPAAVAPAPVEPLAAPVADVIAPVTPAPAAPAPVAPAPVQTMEPIIAGTAPAPTPVAPAPAPAPAATLPQPTAPFSSPRPASLGDRVINPLNPVDLAPPLDLAAQMNQELAAAMPAPAAPAPEPVVPDLPPAVTPEPVTPPTSEPIMPPTPEPVAPMTPAAPAPASVDPLAEPQPLPPSPPIMPPANPPAPGV